MRNLKNKKWKKTLVCLLTTVCAASAATAGVAAFSNVWAETGATGGTESAASAITPSSLFTAGKAITVSDNGKLPDYAINGQRVYQADWVSLSEETITEDMLPDSRKYGVKVVSNSATSRLEFNNAINIDGFTKDDTLVEFVPVTSLRVSSADFTGMKIWITDADDENTWVCVNMYAVGAQYGGATRITVETSNGISAAYRWGNKDDRNPNWLTTFYEGGRRDFYGATYLNYYDNTYGKNSLKDVMYEPFAVYYDTEDMAVYVSSSTYGAKACVLDLDDTEHPYIGVGNAFSGFKNNRVKLSMQTYDLTNPAEYVILNVANHSMNGTALTDTDSPEYLERIPEGGVPVANVGKEYKAFPIEYYDLFDGECDYKVYVKKESDPDSAFAECPTKAFTPAEQTRYVLKYVAKDSAGNETINEYMVTALYAVDPLNITLDGGISDTYNVGNEIVIPQATATGGSGPLDLSVKVIHVDSETEATHNGKTFVPRVAGKYAVIYTVKDYVGNVYTEKLTCQVISTKQPVYAAPLQMYKKFVSGTKTQLPEVAVYDYDSLAGQRVTAVTEVTVSSVSNPTVKETVTGYVFTPDKAKFGDKVSVEYKSYCKNYPNETPLISTFEVEIVEDKYSWDYLWNDDNATIGYNSKDEKATYASLTAVAAGEASLGFINPLQAEYFEFQFGTAAGKDTFDAVRLDLVDFIDSSKKISVEIAKDATNSQLTYVTYNGEKRLITGAFGGATFMNMTYENGKLYDNQNIVVADCSDFDGFPSHRVWATVTLVGAKEGAELRIGKIGAHNLSAKYNTSGELTNFSDTVRPTLEYDGLIPGEAEINAQVTLPAARAYDACSPYVEAFISITSPSGNEIVKDKKADEAVSFTADEYGVYNITYWATDASGKKKNVSFTVSVHDLTKPYIIYNGPESLQCKAGETLTFADVTCYDAVDDNLTLCVFVIQPNGIMTTLKNTMQFRFEKAGNYTLRYYVFDTNYNATMLDVKISVTE